MFTLLTVTKPYLAEMDCYISLMLYSCKNIDVKDFWGEEKEDILLP